MDPGVAVPLHFTLEFLSVAAFGGIAAWAAQRRARTAAGGAMALFVSQCLHTGQFVTGEDAAVIVGLRLAGMLLLAAALWFEPDALWAGAEPGASPPLTGILPLAFGTAGAAGALAYGHRSIIDRQLWGAAWASIALGELWLALAGTDPGLLQADLGPHVLRALGAVVLGVWAWRRTVTSIQLRVIGALALVLIVIVLVAGTAILRVQTAGGGDDRTRIVSVASSTQGRALSREVSELRAVAAASASTFQASGFSAADVARLYLEAYEGLAAVAVAPTDEEPFVAGDRAVAEQTLGLAGDVGAGSTETTVIVVGDRLVGVGLARVDAGVVAVAQRLEVDGTGADDLELALAGPDGEILGGDGFVLPDRAIEAISEPADGGTIRPWTGRIDRPDGELAAAAFPVGDEGAAVVATVPVVAPPLARALFAALVAPMFVAVMIALWLSSRIVRPVLELTEAARRVEEGNLEVVPEVSSADELGTLGNALGSMTTALRSTAESERETRTRLEAILGGMGEALIAMDEDYAIVSFNPAAEEITGVAAEDAIGRLCHEVYGELTAARDGRPICDSICPLRYDGGRDETVRLDRADGRRVGLAVTCSPLRDAEGKIVGGVDLLRDVTAERRADETRQAIIRHTSHELRTPLTPLLSGASALRARGLVHEKGQAFLDLMLASGKRLLRTVEILANVAEMQGGEVNVEPVPVSARSLVYDAVERRPEDADRLRAVAAKTLPRVVADPEKVGKVLDELIDNALRFSGEGAVTVRARVVDGGVEFSVKDRGPGIDPGDHDRLFEGFVQQDVSETREHEGLGLGLTYAQGVVQSHGSRVELDSTTGKGSTFSFVLQREAPSKGRKAAGRRRRRSGG